MDAATQESKIINFRAPAAKRALIDHAAEISGKNRTDFILDASCEKAREILNGVKKELPMIQSAAGLTEAAKMVVAAAKA